MVDAARASTADGPAPSPGGAARAFLTRERPGAPVAKIDVEAAKDLWWWTRQRIALAAKLRATQDELGDTSAGAQGWMNIRRGLDRVRKGLSYLSTSIRASPLPKGHGGADKLIEAVIARLDRADIEVESACFYLKRFEETPSSLADTYDPPRPGRRSIDGRADFVREIRARYPNATKADLLELDKAVPFLGATQKSRTLTKLMRSGRAHSKRSKPRRGQ